MAELARIAQAIAGAQYASDCGKWHKLETIQQKQSAYLASLLPESLRNRAESQGYGLKDALIMQAIRQISCAHCGEFRFFVMRDCEGIADFIVYFDVKLCGKRQQVSFHSFNKNLAKFCAKSRNSCGHWDEKSSRAACIDMMRKIAEV